MLGRTGTCWSKSSMLDPDFPYESRVPIWGLSPVSQNRISISFWAWDDRWLEKMGGGDFHSQMAGKFRMTARITLENAPSWIGRFYTWHSKLENAPSCGDDAHGDDGERFCDHRKDLCCFPQLFILGSHNRQNLSFHAKLISDPISCGWRTMISLIRELPAAVIFRPENLVGIRPISPLVNIPKTIGKSWTNTIFIVGKSNINGHFR